MRAAIAFVLSFISSSLAYMVLTPNNVTGWTTQGGQIFTWSTVDTDEPSFSAVLTNQDGVPNFAPLTLSAQVTGSSLSAVANPPPGGFQTGTGFRLNFMAIPNQENQNTGILAQSQEFTITEGSSTISASGTTGSSTTSTQTGITGTTAGTTDSSSISDSSATGSGIPASSTPTSGAVSSYLVQPGLLVLFSLLGFTLA